MAEYADRIQALMDEVYGEWRKEENSGKGKWDILSGFSEAHQIAVVFGNFNYQVGNGGLEQWIYNGYFHEDSEKLAEYLAAGAGTDERCKKILDQIDTLDRYAQETDCDRYGSYYEPDGDGESGFIGDLANCGAFDTWYYQQCDKDDWWKTVCGIIDKTAPENTRDAQAPEPYATGADFWCDTAAKYGNEEAFGICGRYFDTQLSHPESDSERQFCRELFAAMYEDTAGKTDPAKLVYPYQFEKADERRETQLYFNSRERNFECARAIDAAISASCYESNYYNLDLAAMKAVHDFGFTRVNLVLAHTIQRHSSDMRYTAANTDWAQAVTIPDTACDGVVLNAHPVLLDGFATHTRRLYDEVGAERFVLPGRPESGESVQGYEIIRAIQFDDQRGFAIGHSPTSPSPYVTWQFTTENGARDYYWGAYSNMLQATANNYVVRVIGHMDGVVKEVQTPLAVPEAVVSTEKPSVLGQLRDAKKAPKPPRDEKPKSKADIDR